VVPSAILTGVNKIIHTVHSIASKENNKVGRLINKISFRFCSVIPVALSEVVRETIIKEYGVDKSNIPVIFNGVDLNNCKEKKDSDILVGDSQYIPVCRYCYDKLVKEKISSAFSSYPCKSPLTLIAPRPITRDDALELSTQMPVS
jgi:hypothetical protein